MFHYSQTVQFFHPKDAQQCSFTAGERAAKTQVEQKQIRISIDSADAQEIVFTIGHKFIITGRTNMWNLILH